MKFCDMPWAAASYNEAAGKIVQGYAPAKFFQQSLTDWGSVMACSVVMLPPAIVFAVLNRYFSVGGLAGSLAGR